MDNYSAPRSPQDEPLVIPTGSLFPIFAKPPTYRCKRTCTAQLKTGIHRIGVIEDATDTALSNKVAVDASDSGIKD